MMNYGFTIMGMGFGWIIGLIILGFIVWLVYSYNIQWHSGQRHSESPENILRERFAKGEISKKEYDQLKDHLRS